MESVPRLVTHREHPERGQGERERHAPLPEEETYERGKEL